MKVCGRNIVLLIFILVTTRGIVSGENVTIAKGTPSVDSRFFDLGQLFSPLLSNFNQNRPAGNPGNQGNFPRSLNPENVWENQNQGKLRPPQNQGFNPQGFNRPKQWQNPQFSNQQEIQRPIYSNNNNFPVQRPGQYPGFNQNTPNWRPDSNQGSNQIPNQGGSNNLNTQIKLPLNQGQSRPIIDPDQNRPIQFPDQYYQHPNNGINNPSDQYPDSESQDQNFNQRLNQYPNDNSQYPNQDWQNLNNGGTLDDIVSDAIAGDGGDAIRGKPVIVPTTTINPNQVFFNNSSDTESPLQRQCVQDCPATPEYNPICGTNNVTYFNPGKFVCARNCGVSVYVARRGVCRRRPM